MEQQDKINLLISIQNHPDEYTEEQLQQLMADDPELTELLEQNGSSLQWSMLMNWKPLTTMSHRPQPSGL